MKSVVLTAVLVLAGCGEAFTSGLEGTEVVAVDGGSVPVETDAQDEADAGTGTGGRAGSGGLPGSGGLLEAGSGGAIGAGGALVVPEPSCCVDTDCPASIPFCSPWGTCYQGGDPYDCTYDTFCESFCVHCSGSASGACEEKRCVCH